MYNAGERTPVHTELFQRQRHHDRDGISVGFGKYTCDVIGIAGDNKFDADRAGRCCGFGRAEQPTMTEESSYLVDF